MQRYAVGPGERYFVTVPGEPEREVTFDEWCCWERAAGFHAREGHAATAGFTGLNGISGRIQLDKLAGE